MLNINRNHIEFMVTVVKEVYETFLSSEVREVLNVSNYGKSDTLGLDAIPEIVYVRGVKKYDEQVIFVTEETDKQTIAGLPETYHPNMQPLVFISDPADRSKYLKRFIIALMKLEFKEEYSDTEVESAIPESNITVRELWNKYGVNKEWESIGESPVAITGATTAITCIFRGKAICSVIANFITGELTLACEKGVFQINLLKQSGKRFILDDLCKKSKKLVFYYSKGNCRRFVTFLGKEGYREHFEASSIFVGNDGVDIHLHHKEPGGPSRPLYLSNLNSCSPVGFILANGEKITEWSHWLPIVKFARDTEGRKELRIYEVYTEPIMAKKGIPMSVTPDLSIFRERPQIGKFMDINKISQFSNPSHFRSMIVICHKENTWLTGIMKQSGYRDIGDYF
ncbi:hypothetical protein KAI92_01560 [Candidatus Parcubacteria bacterium]|nr:hypothetical protein [Candidatus Parcubacteria bacterium]